jgi:CCR4-NOT transcription complex subunit 1
VEELMQDLKNRMAEVYKTQEDSLHLRLLFAEWTRVCRHSMTSNALYRQFGEKILQSAKGERLCFFFRLCTETCIELYQPSSRRPQQSMDAYTKLVGYMVRIQDNYTSKITMVSHVLSIAVLVLAHQHESLNTQFNQKPFLKLFTSLFIELYQATSQDKETITSYITIYR